MRLKDNYEIVEIADEHIVVSVGKEAAKFNGVVVLSDAASYLLRNMHNDISKDKLIDLLIEEYDVNLETAKEDVDLFLRILDEYGIIMFP